MAQKTAKQLYEKATGKKLEVIYIAQRDQDKAEYEDEIERGVIESKAIGCLLGHYREGAL